MSSQFIDADGNSKNRTYSEPVRGWTATASADNALTTATKAGATGRVQVLTSILASYGGAKTGLLQVKDGTTVVAEYYVVNADNITLEVGIPSSAGAAISVELAASGTPGTLGKVSLVGYTV